MAISNSLEDLDHNSKPPRDSDSNLSIRLRTKAGIIKDVPDSSSDMNELESEDLSKESSVENKNHISEVDHRKEKVDSLSDREDCGEKVGNGEDGGSQDLNVSSKFVSRPSAPVHTMVKESPLSSDAIFQQSHAGLFNLCVVVLVALNGRLIIENLMKYGFLIKFGFWFSSRSLSDWPLLICCLALFQLFTDVENFVPLAYSLTLLLLPLGAFLVEKLAHHKFISEPVVVSLHAIITTAAVLRPVFMILRSDSSVQSGIALMFFSSIVWLKLVSYAHTNYDMRELAKSVGKPSYPRTTCIRKGWVIGQLVQLVIFTGVMGFIIEQYINPIVQNSQHPLKGNLLYAIERVLKLSVPTLYVWLCMFYCIFHLWLNILAELLCFGDREFYKDWWNAKTVKEYWRMWNMPVHKWILRHVYIPCSRNGIQKGVAFWISFFISAIFHELLFGVPCHIFKFWAFSGMMLQVPLVNFSNYLQKKFRNTVVGNMIFWFFFSILGQPMCVLLYYHDMMNQEVRNE